MVARSGYRMPAETATHERTLIAWPTEARRTALWGTRLTAARDVHAAVARAVVAHEPVTVIADPRDAVGAAAACGPDVEVVAEPIDDSWIRDTGPIIVRDTNGARRALHFRFNAWGGKYTPYDHDATIGTRIAARLGLAVHEVDFVLEGGSITTDGAGTLVTTERCLLNPNRNPGWDRTRIESVLRDALGITRVVWLADGIAEDAETDGHVDNVVVFVRPGRVILQGCDDRDNPNHALALDNRARLETAGLEVVEISALPYAGAGNVRAPVPYVNFYVANGLVVVPTVRDAAPGRMLDVIAAEFPDRSVVAVPGEVLAYGGGGVHCITQPVPAGAP
jgi:agmatine deiminase